MKESYQLTKSVNYLQDTVAELGKVQSFQNVED